MFQSDLFDHSIPTLRKISETDTNWTPWLLKLRTHLTKLDLWKYTTLDLHAAVADANISNKDEAREFKVTWQQNTCVAATIITHTISPEIKAELQEIEEEKIFTDAQWLMESLRMEYKDYRSRDWGRLCYYLQYARAGADDKRWSDFSLYTLEELLRENEEKGLFYCCDGIAPTVDQWLVIGLMLRAGPQYQLVVEKWANTLDFPTYEEACKMLREAQAQRGERYGGKIDESEGRNSGKCEDPEVEGVTAYVSDTEEVEVERLRKGRTIIL